MSNGRDFIWQPAPVRVLFAAGVRRRLAEELARLGCERVLVLCSPGREASARALLREAGVTVADVFAEARRHVPRETVTRAAERLRAVGADGLLCIGGGSAVGLAKALALEAALPIIALPTTYSGSEMTPIWGISAGGRKQTGRDERVRPRLVLYDPEMSHELPAGVAGPSAMNALAHCVEAHYAAEADPVTRLMAEEGARALAEAVPGLMTDGIDAQAREAALYGAWLAGACLGAASMGLHHRLCHVLGGGWDLPHAELHALVLPYVYAWNREAVPETDAALGRALGRGDVAVRLRELSLLAGAPASLADMGVGEAELDGVVGQLLERPTSNPRALEAAGLEVLLEKLWRGGRVS